MFNIKIICFVIDILISKQFYKFIYVLLVPIGGIFIIGLSEVSGHKNDRRLVTSDAVQL